MKLKSSADFERRMDAIFKAGVFLKDLLSPQKTPRVPKAIRNRAAEILMADYPKGMSLRWMMDLERFSV